MTQNWGLCLRPSCFFGVFVGEICTDEFLNPLQHFRRSMQVSVPQRISRDSNQSCYLATGSNGDALRGSAQAL